MLVQDKEPMTVCRRNLKIRVPLIAPSLNPMHDLSLGAKPDRDPASVIPIQTFANLQLAPLRMLKGIHWPKSVLAEFGFSIR